MTNTQTPTTPSARSRRKFVVPLIILGLLVGGAVAGLVWFFGGDAPPEVDLETAASVLTGDTVSGETTSGNTEVDPDSIDGTWTVDTSVGEFTLEAATTSTFVGFRVDEVLRVIGATTAVGRTPAVSGSIEIADNTLTAASIVADLTSLVSDEQRRNMSIQRALGTSANPNATFILTEPIELGAAAASGDPIQVLATGDLTINGITQRVEITLDAQLVSGMILIAGTTEVTFSDYHVSTPTAQSVLSVEDHGVIEIQLWLDRG